MGTEIEKLQKIEMPEPIKTALNEFLQWYNRHYTTMPLDIEVDEQRLTIYIRYDVTEDLEDCVFECIQQTKRILTKEVDEEKIGKSCDESCLVEVGASISARFDDVLDELTKRLNKYGVWWEKGWEDLCGYLVIYIPIQQ